MNQADELEAALVAIERTFDEQNETLEALFASAQALGSISVQVDERELGELMAPRELSAPRPVQPAVIGARC